MSIESKVYTQLTTATALTALVATNIFPEHLIQGETLPGIVYRRAPGGQRVMSLSGYTGLENPKIEVSVYATSIDQRRAIGEVIISVMEAATAFTAILPDGPIDDYVDDIATYRRTMEFSVWHQE